MTLPPFEDQPNSSDDRLNRLLDKWAAPLRLTDDQAESVRLAIVGSPEALGNEWWQGFFGHVTGALHRSHAAAQTGPFAGRHVPSSFVPGGPGIASTSVGYRAYLRIG
jgi:hypothetical protein